MREYRAAAERTDAQAALHAARRPKFNTGSVVTKLVGRIVRASNSVSPVNPNLMMEPTDE